MHSGAHSDDPSHGGPTGRACGNLPRRHRAQAGGELAPEFISQATAAVALAKKIVAPGRTTDVQPNDVLDLGDLTERLTRRPLSDRMAGLLLYG
jgi:hypothetical protein